MPSTTITTHRSFHCAAENLSVQRGGRHLINRLSVSISAGTRLAIVGENGRGKTTLLHTLIGRITPEEGHVVLTGSWGIAEQELHTSTGSTVGDLIDEAIAESRAAVAEFDDAAAVLAEDPETQAERFSQALEQAERLNAWDADRRVDIALEGLHACTDRQRPLATLSVGQRYRVRLACLLGANYQLLLLDEPTNHLDASGIDFLTRAIQEHSGAVALISHDRQLLRETATHFLDLDPSPDGEPRFYGDGYIGWQQGRRRMRESWEQEHQRQVEEEQRLREALSSAQNRLSTGWRPDKGTGKHQRQSRAPGVVQQVKRQAQALDDHRVTVPQPPMVLNMPVLQAKHARTYLSAEAVTCAGRLAQPVSMELRGGDKWLVTGANGAGKSTLLSILAGQLQPSSGGVTLREGTRLALLGQENPHWNGDHRASEVFDSHMASLISAGRIRSDQVLSLSSLGLLDVQARSTTVAALSQGQQRRLELAMRLAERPHVLLLDEPSNHLAMHLVEEVTQALITTGAAVVLTTHDRQMIADLEDFARLILE